MAQRLIITDGALGFVSDGQTDTGTVGIGGSLDVGAGGNAVNVSVAGNENILSGGSDDSAQILNGGVQTVEAGGTASAATIDSGGVQTIQSGGVASGATIDSGGAQIVQSGASANDTEISGGVQTIQVGGVASNVVIGSGGTLIVQSGGVATNTVISGGTLDVQSGGTLSGTVTFDSAGTLQIDGTTMPTATIDGFVSTNQTIDLTGLAYGGGGTAALTNNNVLDVSEGNQTVSLQLDPAQNYTGHSFALSSDGQGGTAVVDPANTWTVGAEGPVTGGGPGTLNPVIQTIDVGGGNYGTNVAYTINLSSNIDLTDALLAINLGAGSTLTINGNGHTIDGEGELRGFLVYSGSVTLENLSITDAVARGGEGGAGGGGGAGLGGGLFIGSQGSATLDNVSFSNDQAIGGAGGSVGTGGGGGGLGGDGGFGGSAGGGGGGVGPGATYGRGGLGGSQSRHSSNGEYGIIPDGNGGFAGNAGGGDSGGGSAGAGGGWGGGGGGGGGGNGGIDYPQGSAGGGGGGGINGGAGAWYRGGGLGGNGGAGGWGGGGGGGGESGGSGGAGGFGGGGGAAGFGRLTTTGGSFPSNWEEYLPQKGGEGGFGGGGGAGSPGGGSSFGGGHGGTHIGKQDGGGGGGGLGAGGDIFVQQGGSLTIEGGTYGAGTVKGGTAGSGSASAGQAYGNGIFYGGAGSSGTLTINLAPSSGQTVEIDGVIADEEGSGGKDYSESLDISGGGTVKLTAANTYSGSTIVNGAGTTLEVSATYGHNLDLQNGGTLDITSGTTFGAEIGVNNGGTIKSASTTTFSNVIFGNGGGLDITGGTIVLANTNNFWTGGTTVSGHGTKLEISGDSVVGSHFSGNGGLTLDAGTALDVTSSTTISEAIAINGDPALTAGIGTTVTYTSLISGAGTLEINGGGTVVLDNASNSYSQGTIIEDGSTLEIGAAGAEGSGAIAFGQGNDTLKIDGTTLPTSRISLFAPGDTIDLAGIAYSASMTAVMNGDTLQINDGSNVYDLTLDNPYPGLDFTLSKDAGTGTLITASNLLNDGDFGAINLATDSSANTGGANGPYTNGPPTSWSATGNGAGIQEPTTNTSDLASGTPEGFSGSQEAYVNDASTLSQTSTSSANAEGGYQFVVSVDLGTSLYSSQAATPSTVTLTIDGVEIGQATFNTATLGTETQLSFFTGNLDGLDLTNPGQNVKLTIANNNGNGQLNVGDAIVQALTTDNLLIDGNFNGINLADVGFDGVTQDTTNGNYAAGNPPSWAFGTATGGLFAPTTLDSNATNAAIPGFAGEQVAFVYAGSDLEQTFTAPVTAYQDPLVVSLDLGTRLDAGHQATSGIVTVELVSGGTVVNGVVTGGTVVGSTTFNAATATPGAANLLEFATQAVSPGATLELVIANNANNQVLVGNADVQAPLTFQVGSAAEFTTALSDATNDSAYQIDATSAFPLSGALTLAPKTGSIVFLDGSTLTIPGSLTFNSASSTLAIDSAETYSGGTFIDAGTVELGASGAAGSGAITFANAGTTLKIDNAALAGSGGTRTFISNTILGFAAGDVVDLTGVAFSSTAAPPTLNGNVLQFTENGTTYQIKFDPNQSFSGEYFSLASDGGTGTDIKLNADVAPTIGNTGNVVQYESGGAATDLDSGITVTDGAGIASATVKITSGFESGDTLNFTNRNGISGSYNSSTGVLTLTGAATAAEYQTALESVTYSFSGNPVDAGNRTITWSATDPDNLTSASGSTTTLGVLGPQVVVGSTAQFYEGGSAATLSATVTVSDTGTAIGWSGETPPNQFQQSAVADLVPGGDLYLIGGSFGANLTNEIQAYNPTTNSWQTLTTTDKVAREYAASAVVSGNIYIIDGLTTSGDTTEVTEFNPSTGTVTVETSNATARQFAAAATGSNGDIYLIGGYNGTTVYGTGEVFNPSANGGLGSWSSIASLPNSVTLWGATAVADGSLIYLFGGETGTGALSNTVYVYNTGNNSWTPLTSPSSLMPIPAVSSAGGLVNGNIVIAGGVAFGTNPDETNATQIFNPTTDTWTTGPTMSVSAASLSQYGIDPGSVSDGSQLFVTAGSTLDRYGEGPVETLSSATVSIAGGFHSGDTLSFTAQGGIAGSYNPSTGVLTLSGTASLTSYETVLESIKYSFSGDPTIGGVDPHRTITWSVTDTNDTTSGGSTTLNVYMTPALADGAGFATPLFMTSAVFADPDLAVTDDNTIGTAPVATVTINNAQAGDELFISGLNGNTINGTTITVGGNDSATLTLTGSSGTSGAEFQTALEEVEFDTTNNLNNATRTLTWSFNDDAGNNANASNSLQTNIDIELPPVVGGTGTTAQFYQIPNNNSGITLDSGISVADPPGAYITGATVTITSGYEDGDDLGFNSFHNSQTINGATISAEYTVNAQQTAGQLTLTTSSGNATAADYQQALEEVQYGFVPAGGDPTDQGADKTRTITWSVTDANGQTSVTEDTTLDVFAQPIVATGSTTPTPTVTSTSGPVIADSNLSVTDHNGTTLAGATVVIGDAQSGDTLTDDGISNGSVVLGNITATFSGDTLSLSGTDTVANYITALEEVQFDAVSPNNGLRTLTWTVDDEAGGNANDSTAVTTNVNATFGPVVTTSGTPTFMGGGTAVTLDGTLTVIDPSSSTLVGATVSIGAGFTVGDLLTINGTTSGAINNGANGTIDYTFSGSTLTLTGTDTVTDYQTALDLVQYTVTPTNGDPTAGGGDVSRAISWLVTDGTFASNVATTTLDTVHVAPTVTAGASVTFTGGGSPVTLDSTLTLGDVDSNGDLTGATVSISKGLATGDLLTINGTTSGAINNGANGTIDYTFSGSTLTLTGTDTVTDYQAALDLVQYTVNPANDDPTVDGSDTSRTISWTVTDGSTSNGTSNTDTSTLNTVHVAPTVTAGASVTFTGGGSPVTLDSTLTLGDVDSNGDLTGATVSISKGLATGDLLTINGTTSGAINNGANGTIDYTFSGSTLTLTGTDTVTDYQAALDLVQYTVNPANDDPTVDGSDTSRTISWTVTDGSTSNGTSNTDTSTLNTVHVAPTVTAGASVTFTGGGSPVTLDSTLTLGDVDSNGDLTGATVSISKGLATGDLLTINGTTSGAINNGANGTIDYTFSGSTLTLTGTDTVTDYQAALDLVQYTVNPANDDPTVDGSDTSRTISWTVTDGSTSNGTSNTDTSTLNTVHVAPTVTAGASVTFTGGGSPVTLDSTLTLGDVDSNGDLTGATVSISKGLATGDLLTINGTTSGAINNGANGTIDYTFSGSTLTLTGTDTVTDYQAALDLVQYTVNPANDDPTVDGSDTSRTISWTVTDGSTSNGTSNTDTSTLNTVHVAPTVTAGASVTFTGGGSPVTLDSTLTLGDVDSNGDLTGATVSISKGLATGDLLTINGTTSGAINNGANGTIDYTFSGSTLTLTGTDTVTDYQAALDLVQYTVNPANDDPTVDGSDTSRTISWTVTDGSTSNGTSNTDTSTLNTVHVAPTVTAGASVTFSGAGPVVLDAGVTVSDVDSGGNLSGATVSIGSGLLSGDTLDIGGLTSGTITDAGGTINYNFAGSTLTLSGTDTLADYQAALDSITYSFSPSGGDATNGGTDTSRTISWQVNDGSASSGLSNVATSTLSVPTTPVVVAAASSVNASASQRFAASTLFSASDAEGESILTYEVKDENTGPSQGFWVLNGTVLPNGQLTTLTAAQLSQLSFVAGSASTPVSDTLEVAAADAAGLGAFTTFTVTAAAHAPTAAPTVTAANELQAPNQTLAGSSLFSGTAFGGNTITSYEVEDTTPDSGYWIFNGVVEPTNQIIDVTAAQLSELSFATGYGSDTLMVRANDGSQWGNITSFTVTPPPNAAPPAGTSATLVTVRNSDGAYEFYNIGRNVILLAGPIGAINPALQVAGVGGFDGTDTDDLLMRDPTTGVFTLYDVSNNNITGNVASFGQVGLEWTVSGFGDFSGHAGETDMLMRDSNTGQFEVYDIANNAITFASGMGQVGLEWSVAGFGDFSTRANESDMLMRNNNTGAFEVYDVVNNAITFASGMGQVGLEWQVAGFGDFSTRANETDMLMRNSNTGAFEVFDIVNNAITFAGPLGQVGLEWTIAGFGDFTGNANETDMLMRNSNTGAFALFDISHNTITVANPNLMGQIGLEWSISGVSATPAAASPTTQLSSTTVDPATAASSATAQLTQAMASFAPTGAATAAPSPLEQTTAPPSAAANLLTTPNAA